MPKRCDRFTVAVMFAAVVASGFTQTPVRADTPKSARGADPALQVYLGANGLLNRGLYELAAAEYRKFLSDHDDHEKSPLAHYGLGVCLFRLKQYDAAVEELEPLHKRSGFAFAAEVGTMLGQCHLIGGRNAEAAKVFQRVVERDADHDLADDAAAGWAEALYLDGQLDDAVEVCGGFRTRWPDSPLAERVGFFHGLALMGRKDFGEAAARFDALLKQFADGPFAEQASLLLAQCYQHDNSIDNAIRQYRRIVEEASSRYLQDALLGLGTLLQQKGEHAEAGEVLDKLLDQSPDDARLPAARLQRGLAHFDQGQFDRAFDVLGEVAEDDDELGDQASYWMGKCKLRGGHLREAAEQLGDAIDRYPNSRLLPEMHYDRAIALLRGEELEDASGALRAFRSRFSDHALAPEALQLLASVEHQRRRFDKSTECCREFLEQYPAHELAASIAFLDAENRFLSEDYAAATDSYRRFLSRYPDDPQVDKAKFRLGIASYRLNRLDDASEFLAQVASATGDHDLFRPALIALGDIHFQRGEWEAAERFLAEYLSLDANPPSADDALLKLGLAQQRQENHDGAIRAYDRLIDQFHESPHHLQAVFERGQAYVALGRLDEAATAFEAVLAEGEESRFAPYALNHLAAIATQRKDFKSASRLFERTAKATPESDMQSEAMFQQAQALMSAQQFPAAEAAFDRFLENAPSNPRAITARAQRAIALARQNRYEDAIQAIERLDRGETARLSPALRSAVRYERAWCLRELGRLDDSAKAYRELLEGGSRDSVNAHALLELSGIEINAKRFSEAAVLLRRFRDLAEAEPDSVDAELREQGLYRLGVCEFELERFEQAAGVFEDFVETFPESPLVASASFYEGEAQFKLGRHDRAVKPLSRVAENFDSDPVYGPTLLRLGESLAALQRWARSERVFTDYLARFPDSEHWYQAQFGVGWAREHQQRFDEAVSAYQKVTARHPGPTAARAQFQIGECLFAKQRYDEAVRELLKVDILYAYPEWSAAALYEAGRCFQKLGKVVEARTHFQQVIDGHADTRWAQLASQRLSETASTGLPGR